MHLKKIKIKQQQQEKFFLKFHPAHRFVQHLMLYKNSKFFLSSTFPKIFDCLEAYSEVKQ